MSRPGSAGTGMSHSVRTLARAAVSSTGRPPGNSLGWRPARRAPRSLARRDRWANFPPNSPASAAAAPTPPGESASRGPARTTPASPASRRAARIRASTEPSSAEGSPSRVAASSPGAHGRCWATSHRRVRRGCRTNTFAPLLAAFRIRRCRMGSSCSASSPTTRIAFARSTSR